MTTCASVNAKECKIGKSGSFTRTAGIPWERQKYALDSIRLGTFHPVMKRLVQSCEFIVGL